MIRKLFARFGFILSVFISAVMKILNLYGSRVKTAESWNVTIILLEKPEAFIMVSILRCGESQTYST